MNKSDEVPTDKECDAEVIEALWAYSEELHQRGMTGDAAHMEGLIHRLKTSTRSAGESITPDMECWLIERFVNERAHFWRGWNDRGATAWSFDAFDAVRFCRQQDAESVLALGTEHETRRGGRQALADFHLAKVVAHLWVGSSAQSAIKGGK